jgi:hypothetical protein
MCQTKLAQRETTLVRPSFSRRIATGLQGTVVAPNAMLEDPPRRVVEWVLLGGSPQPMRYGSTRDSSEQHSSFIALLSSLLTVSNG